MPYFRRISAWVACSTNSSRMPRRFTAMPARPLASNISSTALPKPPARTFSSTVRTFPVAEATRVSSSSSRGLTKRQLTTAASIPSSRRRLAASRAGCTVWPMAKTARSAPSRRISALPISRARGSSSSATPSPLPRGYRTEAGPPHSTAVLSMCCSSFSSLGAMTTMFGMARRYEKSKTPLWVAPSSPAIPPRSMASTTGSLWRQTSWRTWS